MRQAAAAADANRSAPRKWLKPNRQEERQRRVVWMSIIQSKQTSKNRQREQQLEQEPHRHPMVHTKQRLTNQLKQQLERESHRQPTLQTELKREWERAYKELLMVPFIFFPKLDFARSSSLGFAGSSSLGRNTTGEEIANDVERAPPDNMSDAEREIRTLLGIRGLKQTQFNMCQVALEEWQSIGQYYTKRVNETQAEVRSVRNELYQLLLSYSAFQGLLITAVAQSSLLQCHNVGFPLALSALATAGVAIGMAQKNMLISGGRPEDSKRNLNFQGATWHHFFSMVPV